MTRQITTITFDLWETLIRDSQDAGRPRAALRIDGALEALRAEGFDVPRERAVDASRRTYQLCDEVRKAEGDVSFEEQVDIFLRAIDEQMAHRLSPRTREQVARRYADSYFEHPPRLDEHALPVLRSLKGHSYRLALICNTGATPGMTQRVWLERVGLASFFETLTFSDEERLSKPAPRIFHATLERVGATPAQAVHVGDHPRNDVEGAKRAGLRAVWLRRKDEPLAVPPDARVDSLDEVPEAIARLAT